MTVLSHEQEKYTRAWDIPEYRRVSPGVMWADLFGSIASPESGETALDLGCGAGAGGRALAEKFSLQVTYLDFVKAEGVPEPFIQQPLWQRIDISPAGHRSPWHDYGYCCDVMEHLPTEFTMLAVSRMLECCIKVFFSISFQADHFGKFVGEPLHLTVKPYTWWRDRLGEIGTVLEARDFNGEGIFYVGQK